MRLTVRKSTIMVGWSVIESADPETPFGDATVEGYDYEIMAIAVAIEHRKAAEFRRCAVDATGERTLFWSPRNSVNPGEVPYEEAYDLARQIRALLTPPKETQG